MYRLTRTPRACSRPAVCLLISAMALIERSAASTEKIDGSATISTLSLAVQAIWVRPLSDGGVSINTMS